THVTERIDPTDDRLLPSRAEARPRDPSENPPLRGRLHPVPEPGPAVPPFSTRWKVRISRSPRVSTSRARGSQSEPGRVPPCREAWLWGNHPLVLPRFRVPSTPQNSSSTDRPLDPSPSLAPQRHPREPREASRA